MFPLTKTQSELENFCPDLHPKVRYGPDGIEVRCDWGFQFSITHSTADSKDLIIRYLYEYLGKLTVLIYELEQKNND